MRHSFAINAVLLLQVLSLSAFADELDAVVVYGDEPVRVGDVELSEFTGSSQRIPRATLLQEQDSIAGLIAHEAGIQYRQAGGIGSYSTITVRAATASQTNIFFDGVLLNNAASGGVDLSQLELLNLESIDIYRGSTPIQLGTSTIGGSVNLRSRRARGNSSQLLLGTGSFNEKKVQLGRQWRSAAWDATASVSHVSSDNDFKFRNDNGTALNPLDDRTQRRENNEFSRNSVLLKVGKQASEWQRYDGLLQIVDREQALPHWQNRSDARSSYDTGSVQLQLNRRTTANDSHRWNHTEGVFLNRSTEHYDDRQSLVGLGAQDTQSTTDVLGVRSYWEAIGHNGTLAANLTLRHEVLDQQDRLESDDRFSATRNRLDAALQYSLFRLDEKLLLTPSLRMQSIADDYTGVVREGDSRHSNTELTPQFGLRWRQSQSLTVTGNLGQHHREPVFFELFGDRGLFIGNDELVAEEGINLDIGLHWRTGSAETGNQRFLSLTGFASWRDELIASVYDSRGTGRSVNTGEARVLGLEGQVQWQWSKRWRSRLSVTAQSARNESIDVAFNGKQLPGEAQLVAFAGLQYTRGRWQAWYAGNLVRERYYDTGNFLPAEDHFSHNLGASYTQGKLRGTLALNNITDDNIEDFNGFPKPGRSIHFKLKYTIDGAPS